MTSFRYTEDVIHIYCIWGLDYCKLQPLPPSFAKLSLSWGINFSLDYDAYRSTVWTLYIYCPAWFLQCFAILSFYGEIIWVMRQSLLKTQASSITNAAAESNVYKIGQWCRRKRIQFMFYWVAMSYIILWVQYWFLFGLCSLPGALKMVQYRFL